MTHHDEASSRAARSAFLATGIAAAGAVALILLPKVRRTLADTIDLAEEAARRWYGAAEEVAEEFTARTAGPREPESAEPGDQASETTVAASDAVDEPVANPSAEATKADVETKRAKGRAASSTSPGHINPKGQKVIRRVGKSPSWKGQYTYELECGQCGHRYGANGPDIERANRGEGRACPVCQGGKPGDPI
ncbi:MAG: hypothetical protein MPN21_09855 [Thermoanaerobaculia bacterium]|nr:hypothetical protein [Thermoanaerobaculia bacterium]